MQYYNNINLIYVYITEQYFYNNYINNNKNH